MAVDAVKCRALKEQLSALPPQEIVIPITRFFDGNDDLASIGCNIGEHPGISAFRNTFRDLQERGDVEAVYARVAELDPGEDSWPFADTVFIVGTISVNELRDLLTPLQPDEIGPGEQFEIPASIKQQHRSPVLAAWWD